jgi:hypothetical protein
VSIFDADRKKRDTVERNRKRCGGVTEVKTAKGKEKSIGQRQRGIMANR